MAASLPLHPPIAVVADDDTPLSRNTVWRRFRRHKVALVGVAVIILMGLVAALANLIAPVDPNFIDNVNWQGNALAPGIAGHILGTDEVGRDLLSRLIFGARISLTVAIACTAVCSLDLIHDRNLCRNRMVVPTATLR